MKISPKGSSKFLAKEDLAAPLTATITGARFERLRNNRGEDEVLVLYFAGNAKPLVLRPVNRKIVIAAYGDESDAWRGKPLEIYVDPNVEMGGEIVGGIRVRIPAPVRPQNGSTLAPSQRPTVADPVAQALHGMNVARTVENLDDWARWAKGIRDLNDGQQAELEHAYRAAKLRIDAANRAATSTPRPAFAAAGNNQRRPAK